MKLTDWLSFQEVNVVKHLPLFGSQIVQPILYNALTLLRRDGKKKLIFNLGNLLLITEIELSVTHLTFH